MENHNHEEEKNWITLVDEEGHEQRFNLLDVVELDGAKYAIMIPEGQETEEEEEEEAMILRFETNEAGEEILVDIEDDDEFGRVCELLDEMQDTDDELFEEGEEREV